MCEIDYIVGDWVETCHLMPAIVQSIDCDRDDVTLYYPHYKEQTPIYTGGSHCSIRHCGVHKITKEYAQALLTVGEERINRLNGFLFNTCHIKSIEKYIIQWKKWLEEDKKDKKKKEQHVYCFGVTYEQHIFYLNKRLEQLQDDLNKAWDEFDKLFKENVFALADGKINNTTQGIYLSYDIINVEKINISSSERIITLRTGEKFLAQRTVYKRLPDRRNIIYYNKTRNKKFKKVKYALLNKIK